MFEADLVPTIPTGLIEGKVEGYDYFFNPRGHKGVLVLFGEGLEVFNSCRARLSLTEMKQVLPWAHDNPQRVDQILDALGKSELISLGKEYSEKLMVERQRATKRVMTVWLQFTDACNLRCEYCCISKKPTRMKLDAAKTFVEKIAVDSEKAGFEEVLIKIAGGEPTLFWTDARALIDWAKTRFKNPNLKVRFHIITNGTMLTQSLIDYACQDKVGVSVSLDGVGKWHDVQRPYINGTGSFEKVNTNINKLLAAGIRPNILAVITKKNAAGMIELAKYCMERDLTFRFGFYRENPTSPNELDNDNAELIDELKKCYAWMAENLPVKNLQAVHKFADVKLNGPKIRNCGIGSNGLTVSTSGNASICQYELDVSLGSIMDNDSIGLMKNQNRYDLDKSQVDRVPGCKNCKWRYTCGGGCPLLTERHFRTMGHTSPYCEVYKAILPVLIELHALQLVRRFQKGKGFKK